MPPLSLPKAPLGHGAAASQGKAPQSGETSSQSAANSANSYVPQGNPPALFKTAGPTNGTSIGQLSADARISAPKQAGMGTLGPSGAGPALSLPALPKLPPPSRTHLKPPVADVMSNSGLLNGCLLVTEEVIYCMVDHVDLCSIFSMDFYVRRADFM